MVQNPPSSARHTPRRRGRRVGGHGHASRHEPSHGTRRRRPDNLQTDFARNFPSVTFRDHPKRCNSNDAGSTFELIAGELRATLMGGGRAWPTFETTRRRHAEARLLMLQNPYHYPRRHAPSLASCSFTSAGLPGGAPINARKALPTGPCCTGAGRADADKRRKGVAGNGGGVTGGQLRDGACVR